MVKNNDILANKPHLSIQQTKYLFTIHLLIALANSNRELYQIWKVKKEIKLYWEITK